VRLAGSPAESLQGVYGVCLSYLLHSSIMGFELKANSARPALAVNSPWLSFPPCSSYEWPAHHVRDSHSKSPAGLARDENSNTTTPLNFPIPLHLPLFFKLLSLSKALCHVMIPPFLQRSHDPFVETQPTVRTTNSNPSSCSLTLCVW
jgi:hypothetical protein